MNPRLYGYALANLSRPDQTFASKTLGIEVTEPLVAALCGLGNIDPQHGTNLSSTAPAAIEVCLHHPLPPEGSTLLTIRPDLDALGAMAVLLIRANGQPLGQDLRDRVTSIAAADRFDCGIWPGPRPLPCTVSEVLADGDGEELAVLNACAFDRTLTLEARVMALAQWMLNGCLPQGYREQLHRRAKALLQSLTVGTTRIEAVAGGRIATVLSMEPGALRLGYRLAPVVVALNPLHPFGDGVRGRKYTIARWADGDADLDHLVGRITGLEAGWGGQAGIKGSPQSGSSSLTLEVLVDLVAAGLPRADNMAVAS